MTTLREAAQQALAALEFVGEDTPHWAAVKAAVKRTQAITALRAALAQQEQEPVARMHADGSGRIISQATYNEAQRQGGAPWSSVRRYTTPLYTHQPRREWRELTDEEIKNLPLYNNPSSQAVEYARAVELALKEKNA